MTTDLESFRQMLSRAGATFVLTDAVDPGWTMVAVAASVEEDFAYDFVFRVDGSLAYVVRHGAER